MNTFTASPEAPAIECIVVENLAAQAPVSWSLATALERARSEKQARVAHERIAELARLRELAMFD
jgi:hypothetical protein